jgi:hypothetical protein
VTSLRLCKSERGKLALPRKQKPFLKGDLHPVAKIIPITEHFQHFLSELKKSFWGDLYGQTRQAWQQFFELESKRQRDRFSGWARYERGVGSGGTTATASRSGFRDPLQCASYP